MIAYKFKYNSLISHEGYYCPSHKRKKICNLRGFLVSLGEHACNKTVNDLNFFTES